VIKEFSSPEMSSIDLRSSPFVHKSKMAVESNRVVGAREEVEEEKGE
jgi:hypothetical protein